MLELAAIIVFGIFAQWIAWRMRIPAIFPLIILGLLLGPFELNVNFGKSICNATFFEQKKQNGC